MVAAVYCLPEVMNALIHDEIETSILDFQKKNGVITLDAEKLRYISSSGIRILYKLYKVQHELRIDNVDDDIFSILYDAGTTEIFTVNKKVQELINDNWEVSGVGATGTVYKIDRDTAIKVYGEGYGFDFVNQERILARQAFISGVPTVIPSRNARVGNCYATIFELINSSSLGEELNDPDRYEQLMDDYVAMIRHLHSLRDTKGVFTDIQELWLKYEYMLREGLNPSDADLVIDLYRNSKHSKNFLHGDIHPGNVMISDDEMVLVDMACMSTGPDIFDVITIFRLAVYGDELGLTKVAEKSMGIRSEMFGKFWEDFAKRYYEVKDRETIDRINEDLRLVTALDFMLSVNTLPAENVRNYYRKFGSDIMDEIIRPNEDRIRKIMTEGKIDI